MVDVRELPWPVDWRRVFGREAPLALEIGFGNGQFLLEQALARPERDHLGIEVSWAGVTRLLRRLGKHDLGNVRGLLGDADPALRHLFRSESLAEVFLNHPCPWPKARHVGRRLLQPAGLRLLADRMRTGAKLTVVTDHAQYADWLAGVLAAQDVLVSCHDSPEAPSIRGIEGRGPTKYQLKAMAAGLPLHVFEWKKERPTAGPTPADLDPSTDMPSLILRGNRSSDGDLFDGFQPHVLRETHEGVEVTVRLAGAFVRAGGDRGGTWLVEVLVQEDALRQEFGVLVVERANRDLLVKLSNLGHPHPTHGVKRAVHGVGAWILRHHAGLELVHETLGQDATTELRASGPS